MRDLLDIVRQWKGRIGTDPSALPDTSGTNCDSATLDAVCRRIVNTSVTGTRSSTTNTNTHSSSSSSSSSGRAASSSTIQFFWEEIGVESPGELPKEQLAEELLLAVAKAGQHGLHSMVAAQCLKIDKPHPYIDKLTRSGLTIKRTIFPPGKSHPTDLGNKFTILHTKRTAHLYNPADSGYSYLVDKEVFDRLSDVIYRLLILTGLEAITVMEIAKIFNYPKRIFEGLRVYLQRRADEDCCKLRVFPQLCKVKERLSCHQRTLWCFGRRTQHPDTFNCCRNLPIYELVYHRTMTKNSLRYQHLTEPVTVYRMTGLSYKRCQAITNYLANFNSTSMTIAESESTKGSYHKEVQAGLTFLTNCKGIVTLDMFAAYLCHLWIEFGRISFSVATLCSVIDEMCAVERVHFIDAINKDVINHLLIRKYCPDSWGTIWMIRDDTMNQRFFDLRQDVSPESCYLLNKRIDAKISENDSVYKSKISFAVQLVDRYKDANKSVFLASMSLHHTILLQYSKIYGNINYVGSNFAADELFWKLPLSCILESFEQVDAFTELFSGYDSSKDNVETLENYLDANSVGDERSQQILKQLKLNFLKKLLLLMALDIVQPTQSKDEFPSFLGSFNTKYFDNLGFYHENHGIMIFCTKVYLAMDQSEFLSDEEIEAVLKHKLRINLVPPGATNLTLTYHDILYHWLYNLAPFFELRYLSHSAGDKSKFEDYNLFCQGKQTWSFIPRLASWKKITFYLESRCCEELAVKQQTMKNKPKLKTKSIQQSARMSFGEVDEYLFPIILLDSSVDKLRRNEDLWTTEEDIILLERALLKLLTNAAPIALVPISFRKKIGSVDGANLHIGLRPRRKFMPLDLKTVDTALMNSTQQSRLSTKIGRRSKSVCKKRLFHLLLRIPTATDLLAFITGQAKHSLSELMCSIISENLQLVNNSNCTLFTRSFRQMMSRDEPSEVDESNVQELEHYLKELYFLGFLRFREADSGRVSTKMFYEYFNLGFSSILKLSLEEMANEQPELEASTGSLCWLTALNEMQINRESVDAQTFAAHFVLCLGIYAQQKGLIHTQMILLQNDLEEPDVSDLMKNLPVESIIVPLRQMKFGHAGCKSLANIIGAVSFSSSSSSAAGTKPKNIYHGKAVREELEDPWIDEDGSVNQEFFELFASKITAILFERPGSTVDFIQGSMCLLSTEQLNRLLNLMLEAKLITRKLSNSAAHKVVVPWLQWSMEETEKVIPHYFVKL